MNVKNIARCAAVLACGLLLLLPLAACVEKPSADTDLSDWEGKEELELTSRDNAELRERYDELKENSALAFSTTSPEEGALFVTESYGDGVKIIGYNGDSTIIVVPETVGEKAVAAIGKSAFSQSNIRAISLPDSVVAIDKGAFAGCDKLATIRVPFIGDGGENTHFGYIFGADSYENNALSVPASLDMVILGSKITEIGENAFAGCKMISAVVLPTYIEKIGVFAFYECRDLVYVSSYTTLKEVGSYAFADCSSLYKLELSLAETIGFGALYGCDSLRSLGLPFVGGSATENRFIGYIFGAETADFNDEFVPKSLYSVSIAAAQCKDIPDRAFAGCAYISEFIFDLEIENIGIRAFYACRSIKSIALPDAVKTIGDDAFFGCDNLESITFGKGVESIGMQAFYGCRSLKSVEIPEKVTEIKASTFALCSSLETVKLGNVRKIGKDAFWRCESLAPVDCTGIEVAEGNESLSAE